MQVKAGAGSRLRRLMRFGGPEEAPAVPDGLEAAHKVADIDKKAAEAEHIRTRPRTCPSSWRLRATTPAPTV
jgi:hypothetical protein